MLRTLVVLPLVLLSLFTLVQSEWTHSWDKPFTPSSRARLIYWINHCLTDANFDRDTQSCPTTELLYSDTENWVKADHSKQIYYRFGHMSTWDVSRIGGDFSMLFKAAANLEHFNINIGQWDTARATNMERLFENAISFNQDLSNWDVAAVYSFDKMFKNATKFDQDISSWSTGSVERIDEIFMNASSFSFSLDGWDVSRITVFDRVFDGAKKFNGRLNTWNTVNAITMEAMFRNAESFSQDLNLWLVNKVTNMAEMFHGAASFNNNIGTWRPVECTNMTSMFEGATKFNQDIQDWTLFSILYMDKMFKNAIAFAQILPTDIVGNKDVPFYSIKHEQISAFRHLYLYTFDSNNRRPNNANSHGIVKSNELVVGQTYTINHPAGLAWTAVGAVNNAIHTTFVATANTLIGTGEAYAYNTNAPTQLPPTYVTSSGVVQNQVYDFVYFTFSYDANNNFADVPLHTMITQDLAVGYLVGVTTEYSPLNIADEVAALPYSTDNTPLSTATRTIKIAQVRNPNHVGRSYFKIPSVTTATVANSDLKWSGERNDKWDLNKVVSMHGMFSGASSFVGGGDGDMDWLVGQVQDMSYMFHNAVLFNGFISKWITSKVQKMHHMFNGASTFNKGINTEYNNDPMIWNVEDVDSMESVLAGATSFNQPLNKWRPVRATSMRNMFASSGFTQDLVEWGNNVAHGTGSAGYLSLANVLDMSSMFENTNYNQDITGWSVSRVLNFNSMFRKSIFAQDIGLSWNVESGNDFDFMFRENFRFNGPLKANTDAKWMKVNSKHNTKMYPGRHMFGYVMVDQICMNPAEFSTSSTFEGRQCGDDDLGLAALAEAETHPLYDLEWGKISCDDEGAPFSQGSAPFINKWAKACCGPSEESVCANNKVRTGFKAADFSRLCMNPAHYQGSSIISGGGSITCDQHIAAQAGLQEQFASIDWSTYNCGDANGAPINGGTATSNIPHLDIINLSADCCGGAGKSRCDLCTQTNGVSENANPCVCGSTTCTNDSHEPFEAWMSSKLSVTAHKGDGTHIDIGETGKIFLRKQETNSAVQYGQKSNGNTFTVDFGKNAPEPIVRAALSITDATSCSATIEYADPVANDVPEFKNDNGVYAKWDTTFKNAQMVSGMTYSNNDRTVTGGTGSGGIMPVTTFAKSMMSSWYVEILVVCADDCTGNNAIGITDLSDKELNTGISLRMDGTLNIQGVVTTDWTDEFSIDSSVFLYMGMQYNHADSSLWFYRNGKQLKHMTWTITIVSETLASAAIGTAVTQGTATGTLEVALDGSAATTTITIRSFVGQTFDTAADLVIGSISSTVALANLVSVSDFTAPNVIKNVASYFDQLYVFGYSASHADRYTLNTGLAIPNTHYLFKRATPRTIWHEAAKEVFAASSEATRYMSWDSVGAHRHWRLTIDCTNPTGQSELILNKIQMGTDVVTGLYCSASQNTCRKTPLNQFRSLCSSPEKYMGSALVDVDQPDRPEYAETCDVHLAKASWESVTWSSFTCKDTPKNLQALEFMGVAGRCCSDGRTTCWKDYERICSLSGRGVSMQKRVTASGMTTNGENFMEGIMVGCITV